MSEIRSYTDISSLQAYLLKQMYFLQDFPVGAKVLFQLLEIKGDNAVQTFDQLHALVPHWLEYSHGKYLLSSAKAQKLKKFLNPDLSDVNLMMETLIKIFYDINSDGITDKFEYEQIAIKIMSNANRPTVTLARLVGAYGHYLFEIEKYDLAQEYLEIAIEYLNRLQKNSPFVFDIVADLGFVYLSQEKYQEAEDLAVEYLKRLSFFRGDKKGFIIQLYFILAESYRNRENFKQALTLYLRILDILDKDKVSNYAFRMNLHWLISVCYKAMKNYSSALGHVNKAIECAQKAESRGAQFYLLLYKVENDFLKRKLKQQKIINVILTVVVSFGVFVLLIMAMYFIIWVILTLLRELFA